MNGFFVVTAVIDASMNFIDVVSLFYNYYRTPLKNWLDHNHKNASALLFSQEFSDTVEKPFYIVMCLFICSERWSDRLKARSHSRYWNGRLPVVFGFIGSTHRIRQTSSRGLSIGIRTAFRWYVFFDELSSDSTWCRFWCNLITDNGEWQFCVWTRFFAFAVWQFSLFWLIWQVSSLRSFDHCSRVLLLSSQLWRPSQMD